MQVQELFEAVEKHPILDELKGKKMDWAEMKKFMEEHTDVFEHKGHAWYVKKDAGVNLGPVATALKKAAKDSADPWVMNRKFILLDWKHDYPINATVILDQRDYKDYDDYKKYENKSKKTLHGR